jgi:predicted nucleotidyltransferase component of viral defense system
MGKKIDHIKLYEIQDNFLNLLFAFDNTFYLTGGTALHRFYYNYRYSDDLDFFTYGDPLFGEYIKEITGRLDDMQTQYFYPVNSRDFHRIIINNMLQVDFVNDRVYREGSSVIKGIFRIDNIKNILSNKISAIIGRDEEKDIFDLFSIAFNEQFKWPEILAIANKKSQIDINTFAQRINSFPLSWLEKIKSTENKLTISEKDIQSLCEDILNERENSLVSKK